MDQTPLSIKDFEIIKDLGSGSFGKVRLVKKKDSGTLFALKSVSLTKLSQKEKDSALNEVRLLASIDIPTVIRYISNDEAKDSVAGEPAQRRGILGEIYLESGVLDTTGIEDFTPE
ncbi:unnamed protein product [Sphagnum balticum]